jgi:hypothetical protein
MTARSLPIASTLPLRGFHTARAGARRPGLSSDWTMMPFAVARPSPPARPARPSPPGRYQPRGRASWRAAPAAVTGVWVRLVAARAQGGRPAGVPARAGHHGGWHAPARCGSHPGTRSHRIRTAPRIRPRRDHPDHRKPSLTSSLPPRLNPSRAHTPHHLAGSRRKCQPAVSQNENVNVA